MDVCLPSRAVGRRHRTRRPATPSPPGIIPLAPNVGKRRCSRGRALLSQGRVTPVSPAPSTTDEIAHAWRRNAQKVRPRVNPPSHPADAPALTYRDAGVDIDAGNEAVRRIRNLVAKTHRPEQEGLDGLGGFAGLMALPAGFAEPVLVSCTDGVGTKLLVAIALDRHDTVGVDLVAMCVNDLLVTGAQPLFLLDYIATGRVRPELVESLVRGVVDGCVQAGASLLGGETAELPGMYQDGHYDLAAFAVGVVDRARVRGPQAVRAGDIAIGLRSSGLHSNGYSLARKALLSPEHAGLSLDAALPGGAGETVGDALLEPTRIYAPAFSALRSLDARVAPAEQALRGAAHITGGGLLENPQRALADSLAVELDLTRVPLPPIITCISDQGVAPAELRRTFNCGLGMILYVAPEQRAPALTALERAGEAPIELGRVVPRESPSAPQVRFAGE
ncbi:MAG: phosphoribosylformylglycinamidine cyclo-ligase [Myxococcales bacterium]|nr:phosphoribosylformylglycinamidine cyclo-ligase [Myxococcales bacterium]MCB9756128.1 phosphoribosylformylglycinamidine cyclo-ligase [Myxococcales bacterium]